MVGAKIDANGALRTCFMKPDNVIGYQDHFVQNPAQHPMSHLSEVVKERQLGNARIGVEMDNYWFTAKAHATLNEALPAAKFEDATGLVNWQRLVKSDLEIEFIRRAAQIVERMHAVVVEMVEPGLPKNRLVAEIYKVAIDGADGHFGDYPAIVPMLPSGMDATAAHLTWDDRPFVAGEGTFFELGGCYRRYHCPLSRTVFLGSMPKKYVDAERAVLAATEKGLAKAAPGNFW